MSADVINDVGKTICEALLEADSAGVPSGHMYMAFNGAGMHLDTYQKFVEVMGKLEIIELRGDVLYATDRTATWLAEQPTLQEKR